MSSLLVTADISKAVAFVKNARKQVLYAEAQACNMTARDVQQFTVSTLLPEKFTLRARGNPWQRPGTKYGFNIRFASPKSSTIESTVGSRADWLDLQEKGGTKSRVGGNLAIVVGARATPTSVIRRQEKPRYLLRNAADLTDGAKSRLKRAGTGIGFKIKLKYSGTEGIFVRDGSELRLMYWLRKDAHIKPTLQYVSHGRKIVEAKFQPNFSIAFFRVLPEATKL